MRILPEKTQCLLIDFQEKLLPAMSGRELCEDRAVMLAKGLKLLDIPMIITQQYTKGLGMSVPGIYEAAGTEKYFDKRTFSCGQDDAIKKAIHENARLNVLVCGVEAHVCVLQTCIDLKARGFNPILVVDAIASRRESDKNVAIQRAVQEGILLTTSESALFELTVDSQHPKFKEISKLVK